MTVPLAHLVAGSLAPLQLAPAALLTVLYALRVRTLARSGRAPGGARQGAFYAGMGLIVVTLASPLGHLSDELLLAHMAEHLLIADLGALLLVLGLTAPILAPALRIGFLDRLRVLVHPAVALPLWAVDFYGWHLPVLYQAAVRDSGVHALEHFMFIVLGVNMWMALLGPLPKPAWFGNLARLAYIIAVRLIGGVLANVFLWSGAAFYRAYSRGEVYWHIAPGADQSTAGAIMMVEGSILTVCLFAWLFLRSAREGEERQELLDFASQRGLELSDARAARAVAAGRGADLRRRLRARAGG